MQNCPCGSGNQFDQCCQPYLSGDTPAPTAEALMRSRYCAFVKANVDYILETVHPDKRDDHDADHIRKWATQSDWLGLEIRDCEGGGADDDQGTVEFVATFRQGGKRQAHAEIATFHKTEDRWYFFDGNPLAQETVRRAQPKVGRNDPCPCGSGKKYKKCCR